MMITNKDIMLSFYQKGANNCASIALIKAAIEAFGINNVIQLEKNSDDFNVTLKDGSVVNFTEDEYQLCIKVANFQPSKDKTPEKQELYSSITHYAQLCYATMVAKYKEINKNENFEIALKKLTNGANARTVSKYLGIQKYCSEAFRGNSNRNCLIAWQHLPWLQHVVYMSNDMFDYYGDININVKKFPKRIQISKNIVE